MSRMYSRKKGKSGSKKPLKKTKISWLRYSETEIEQLIVKLAKQGKSQSEIGMILRDTYGVPDIKRILKTKIGKILENHKLSKEIPEDLLNLIKKEINLMKHLEINKKDMSAKRGLILTESKIKRLAKYYRREGRLSKDWVYDRDKVKLLI
ncbi:MAG: 30S ribosomal protein S15 [archaeon]